MLFFKLVNSGFKRNIRSYGPYLIATSMLVAINYIFLAVQANTSLKKLNTGAATSSLLDLGFKFIFLVSVAFLIYVNRFLWQERRKELALYSMLGMTSKNLQLLTIIEKCYLLVISLAIGLVSGIIFEKLAFLGLGYLLKIDHLSQSWLVPLALWKTIGLIAVLFVLLMIIDLVKFHRLTPSQLWQSQNTTVKHYGVLYSLAALLGFVLLIGAYYITLTIKPRISAISHFFLAVLLLVVGTYLLFIIGSIVFLQFLQKQKNYYYQPRHFIAVSGMRQRMEQNGASLATICLLCSSILVILFTSVTLYVGINNTVKSYSPQDVVVTTPHPLTNQQRTIINQTARQYHAHISNCLTYTMSTPQYGYWRNNGFISQGSIKKIDNQTSTSVIMLTTKEYNRITGKRVHLANNQALVYSNNHPHVSRVTINHQTYNAKKINPLFDVLQPGP